MHEKIKLIMKLLHMENMDVARLLQVDVSLVSKWRSGVRSMLSNPEYVKRFVAYALQVDRKNHYQTIRDLLKGEYAVTDVTDPRALEVCLRDWLVSDSQKDDLQSLLQQMMEAPAMKGSSHLLYWEGTQGRREAVRYFTEYAIACPPKAEIISYTTENGLWFSEDPEYTHSWGEAIRRFLDRGNSLKIVHPVNRSSAAMVRSMTQWLPLHIRQDVDPSFLRRYDEGIFIHFTIIVLTGKLALFGISTDLDKQCRTYTTTDPGIVSALGSIAKRAVKKAVPLLRRYTLKDDCGLQLTNALCEAFRDGAPCYFYNDLSWLMPAAMGPSRVLKDYLTCDEWENRVMPVLHQLHECISKCPIYCLYSVQELKRYLKRDKVVLGYISLITGRIIAIPSEIYRKCLDAFVDECLKDVKMRFGVVDDATAELFGDLALWTGGNNTKSFFTIYQPAKPEILEIREYTISASFLTELEHIWQSIPYLKKDKQYIYERYIAPLIGA